MVEDNLWWKTTFVGDSSPLQSQHTCAEKKIFVGKDHIIFELGEGKVNWTHHASLILKKEDD